MAIIVDIETCPLPKVELEALMPEDMRNPVMPDELENPEPPDLSKCPAYAKDKDSEAKQEAWKRDKIAKHEAEVAEKRAAWELATFEARQKFVEDAALHAERGVVKMIGIQHTGTGETLILVNESDPDIRERLLVDFPDGVTVQADETEAEILRAAQLALGNDENEPIVTYYGNTFDFPFLARRAAIVGARDFTRWIRSQRRGRYFLPRFVDLFEEWQMGDRQIATGGLEGLCRILGVPLKKNGNGGTFWKWYQEDPEEGVHYLLNDIEMTRAAAERMGVV